MIEKNKIGIVISIGKFYSYPIGYKCRFLQKPLKTT